jgi:glucose-1-phosphate cytidylyltransferase
VKVGILCGGQGTRLREETEFRPKPMVEIGGKPMLLHIMRHYARFGHTDFVLLLGYKGDVIRNYFINYPAMNSDVRVRIGSQSVEYLQPLHGETGWSVTLAETGPSTPTGARLLRAKRYLDGGPFLCTYGDGVSNVNIEKLVRFHRERGKLATVTGVRPLARFGLLEVEDGVASRFREKPRVDEGWINGGFFVFEPNVFSYLTEESSLEAHTLEKLAADKQLAVYEHPGYWAPMDTYREAQALNEEWDSGKPGWLEPS